jgi:hypothetical protein
MESMLPAHKCDILILCDKHLKRPWLRDRIPGIEKAIQLSGLNVNIEDIYTAFGDAGAALSDANRRHLKLRKIDLVEANESLYKTVTDINPSVLLLATADNYRDFTFYSTVERIRSTGVFVVGFLGDDQFNHSQYRFFTNWFDLYIVYVKNCLRYYRSLSDFDGYYLPNSCYLEKGFDDLDSECLYDSVLIGGPIADRVEIIRRLVSKGYNIAIYGPRSWELYLDLLPYYHGYVDSDDFDKRLGEGKIVLALLKDHITGALHMNTKIWEAVRVGRLPIVTYYEPLISDYGFTDGLDIVLYKDLDDLVLKFQQYIEDTDRRIETSKRLHAHVMSKLDYSILYEKLFIEVLGKVREKTDRGNPYNGASSAVNKPKYGDQLISLNAVKQHLMISKLSENSCCGYVYYNIVENGRMVRQFWPFIDSRSIFFSSDNGHIIKKIFNFFYAKITHRAIHINQFVYKRNKKSLFGVINQVIDSMVEYVLRPVYAKYLLKYIVSPIRKRRQKT